MQVLVLCNDLQKEEMVTTGIKEGVSIVWAHSIDDFKTAKEADVFIELLFENLPQRLAVLKSILPKTVVINSVTDTLEEVDLSFIRINGWPTFLKAATVEASCLKDEFKMNAEEAFAAFNKRIHWLPDDAGFVTPRVISTIINEAYFTLAAGVSTMEEIDIAMKLGTAYPYGPFAWSREIGLQNISTLLHKLSKQHKRYSPSELLVQETDKAI
jgi:3-hydroxybutyryl-CoA dehydrogenase